MQEKSKTKRNTEWFGRLLVGLGGGLFYVLAALVIINAGKDNISLININILILYMLFILTVTTLELNSRKFFNSTIYLLLMIFTATALLGNAIAMGVQQASTFGIIVQVGAVLIVFGYIYQIYTDAIQNRIRKKVV